MYSHKICELIGNTMDCTSCHSSGHSSKVQLGVKALSIKQKHWLLCSFCPSENATVCLMGLRCVAFMSVSVALFNLGYFSVLAVLFNILPLSWGTFSFHLKFCLQPVASGLPACVAVCVRLADYWNSYTPSSLWCNKVWPVSFIEFSMQRPWMKLSAESSFPSSILSFLSSFLLFLFFC